MVERFYQIRGMWGVWATGVTLFTMLSCSSATAPSGRRTGALIPKKAHLAPPTQVQPPGSTTEEEHGPFDQDRMGIAAYRQWRRMRADHAERHQRQVEVLGDKKLPPCSDVRLFHHCPLLQKAWRVQETPNGASLRVRASSAEMRRLEKSIHCHQSVGQLPVRPETHCPLQMPAVRITVERDAESLVLHLEVLDSRRLAALRRRVQQLTAGHHPTSKGAAVP